MASKAADTAELKLNSDSCCRLGTTGGTIAVTPLGISILVLLVDGSQGMPLTFPAGAQGSVAENFTMGMSPFATSPGANDTSAGACTPEPEEAFCAGAAVPVAPCVWPEAAVDCPGAFPVAPWASLAAAARSRLAAASRSRLAASVVPAR